MSCNELMERLKKKDPKALEEIIKEYNQYVAAIVYTIFHGYLAEIDIQEIVNQVFFSLWRNAEKLDPERYGDLKPYLRAIARNVSINEKKKFMQILPLEEDILGEVNESFSQVELKMLLSAALKQLSRENQILLLKFYFQGKTVQQIAEEENKPQSTIKTKLKRSREKLRIILEKEGVFYEN